MYDAFKCFDTLTMKNDMKSSSDIQLTTVNCQEGRMTMAVATSMSSPWLTIADNY